MRLTGWTSLGATQHRVSGCWTEGNNWIELSFQFYRLILLLWLFKWMSLVNIFFWYIQKFSNILEGAKSFLNLTGEPFQEHPAIHLCVDVCWCYFPLSVCLQEALEWMWEFSRNTAIKWARFYQSSQPVSICRIVAESF